MSKGKFWSQEELDRLWKLARGGTRTRRALAELMNRSASSIDDKLKLLGVSTMASVRRARVVEPGAMARKYEVPEALETNHLKHCLAVLRANHGFGFPAYDIPAQVRVAA